jgi:hypothetical protein
VTTALALVATRAVEQRARPCVATADGEHCIAGLLLGVACCADGACALCEAHEEYMRRLGRAEIDVAREWVRSRVDRRDRCPVCGFPPPEPLAEIPPLPRLDRSDRVLVGAARCRYCDRKILGTRRRYCDRECWNAYVVWTRRLSREVARV